MRKRAAVSGLSRRELIEAAGAVTVGSLLDSATGPADATALDSDHSAVAARTIMSTIRTKDGVEIFYKDWSKGQPIVFSHGWPLSADAWDPQMLFFGRQDYRVIAHDRRGHGRSSQPWSGYNNDTFADDLSELLEKLNLTDVILVAHSMGGGEIARYVGRHGTKRLAKMVFIGAVPPTMLKTDKNPGGLPMSVFDDLRKGIAGDRSQFYKDVSIPFFGFNKPGAKVSEGLKEQFWRLGMQSSVIGSYNCVKAFSEDDFTEDLKKIDVPTLFLHGEADQIVPADDASVLAAKIVKNAKLNVIPGAPHGMAATLPDQINREILNFIHA